MRFWQISPAALTKRNSWRRRWTSPVARSHAALSKSSPGVVMAIGIIEIHHVNVVVPRNLEEVTKHFYGSVMGLQEIPKPMESQGRGGAWYQLGGVQLHLSVRSEAGDAGRGHVCYTV